jgi:ABC-type branched-subunit amino acid transport system substrate-binding protein
MSRNRMRFEEANAAGGIHGRSIKYIAEDSQYRMPIAVQKANKLVNRDKAFFLIGSIGTPMNNAIFPMLEKKDVPNLFPYTAARSMYEPHHRLKFANLAPYYGNIRAGLKYFVEKRGKKRVDMVTQTAGCNYVVPLKGGEGVNGLYGVTAIPIMYADQATGKAKAYLKFVYQLSGDSFLN